MDPSSDKKFFFQTITFKLIHPETGKQFTRKYFGEAFFSPDEVEKFKDIPFGEIIVGFELDIPYNPFEDDLETHKEITDLLRDVILKESANGNNKT